MSDDNFERFSLAVSAAVNEATRGGLSTSDTAQALIVAAATLLAVRTAATLKAKS